jgi:ferredoxin-thioredoxin reductase catalytic chain
MNTTKQTILDKIQNNAKENGYYLCPDKQLFNDLIDGLVTNSNRYGYGSCPCRVASGEKTSDGDIICPCEYRDADVNEYGMCYCGLFVSKEMKNNPSQMGPIPERRPQEILDAALTASETKQQKKTKQTTPAEGIKVWRCTVCGYLCARDMPPPLCPICKAKAERFEPFNLLK